MKKKLLSMLVLMLFTVLTLTPVTSAFHDIKDSKGEKHINQLKDRGIIKGSGKGKQLFKPKDSLSYAQAVVMLDDAFDLSLAHYTFTKAPKPSDMYTKVKDNQWYSQAFVDGYYNDIVFDKDINPNAAISREEFAFHLINQLDRKIDYPLVAMYITYKDENKVNKDYLTQIQKLLLLKFEELGKDNKFNPTKSISREEAAIWLENALTFVDEQLALKEKEAQFLLTDIAVKSEAITSEVNRVTISATAPHPGYGASINEIKFSGNTAYISLQQTNPDPDKVYPQVITTISVVTYISSQYKVEVVTPK